MGSFRQDLAHAVRRLAQRPAADLVATATLAIGIGGATAIFSVAHAVILRPLPYAQPERLVLVWQNDLRRGQPFVEMSYPTFRDWRDTEHASSRTSPACPSTNQSWTLRGPRRAGPARRAARSPGISSRCSACGRRSAAPCSPRTTSRGAPACVVLGHALWRDRFGADARRRRQRPSCSTRTRSPSSASCRQASPIPRAPSSGRRSSRA